jgi:hypothetical protein
VQCCSHVYNFPEIRLAIAANLANKELAFQMKRNKNQQQSYSLPIKNWCFNPERKISVDFENKAREIDETLMLV